MTIFLAGFASVFLLGFQSRSVNHGNYAMAAMGSFVIAQTQTTLWGQLFANLTWEASFAYGLSGAVGIVSSMYVHERWFNKKNNKPEEPKKPKVLILGHGRHGKDTVAEILRDDFGFNFVSSSWCAAEKVMMPYFRMVGTPYANVDECYADRHSGNNRAVWHKQIVAYNTPDAGKLCREILSNYDMYVGMRSNAEYQKTKHRFDLVLWVDASGRGIPAESPASFNIDLDPYEMEFISNDGSLKELRRKVYWVMAGLDRETMEKPFGLRSAA